MAQERYILHFTGSLPLPDEAMRFIQSKTHIVDVSRKTVLVEGNDDAIQQLTHQLPDWAVQKETSTPIPTTRPTVQKPPKL